MSDIPDSEDRLREEIGLDQGGEREDDPRTDDPVAEGNALAPPD